MAMYIADLFADLAGGPNLGDNTLSESTSGEG